MVSACVNVQFIRIRAVVLFLAVLYGSTASGQKSQVNFVHHTVENGLSQSSVLSIAQDSTGFMWFGTKDGLNKFNTRTFEVFKHDKNDSSSLSSSFNINALLTDHRGKVWVGTQDGLNLYLDKSNTFRHFLVKSNRSNNPGSSVIRSLYEDKSGIIWVGTDSGLFNLLPGGHFRSVEGRSAKGQIFSHQLIRSIYQDHEGAMWIATSKGLTRVTRKNGRYIFRCFEHHSEDPGSLPDNDITSVAEDLQQQLWIGTHQFGLLVYNTSTESFERVQPGIQKADNGNSNVIRKLTLDKQGRLWIGMLNGILLFDPLKRESVLLKHDAYNTTSLNQNSIYDIHCDASGSMWVGTYYGGINVYHRDAMPFSSYQCFIDKNSLSSNVVSAIAEDASKNLWIGTEAEGLNYYDRQSGLFTSFKHDVRNPRSLSSNLVKAIAIDQQKRVWVGTYEGGLDLFFPTSGTFKHYSSDAGKFRSRRIICLLMDSRGRLWAGTKADGLFIYDTEQDNFRSCASAFGPQAAAVKHIRHLYEDRRHQLWAATNTGTYCLAAGAPTFKKIQAKGEHILLNDINVISEDTQGYMWLGSYELGLIRYHPVSRSIHRFTVADGLPSNVILGILEDEYKALWISTDNGLSKRDGRLFRNYTVKDGLPGNVFNYNSFLRDSYGQLFFGGYNGLLSFFPRQIKTNVKIPAAVFTRLRLFNKPVRINDQSHLLKDNINGSRELTFSHDQNIFSIDFAVLNYIKPEKNKYAFKLKGFEKYWNYVADPSATFTNLPPGTYTLLIRGSNNDGVWSKVEKLTIHILPPFWATWWAFTLYFLFVAALLFLVLRYIWLRALIRREQQIHQMKLDFFTNVSHEIRMPLTLIMGPLETLITESLESPVLHRKLLAVRKNAGRLTRLVTELMDFRKAEAGKMTLNISPGNLVNFSREIFLSFQHLAVQHDIDYRFEAEEQRIEVYFDKLQLEKVIFNLLSNAFKFTPDHGLISLQVAANFRGNVRLTVSDNGIGIAADERGRIFTNFYQVKDPASRHSGTGIGLALSKKIAEFHHGNLFLLPQESFKEVLTSFCLELKPGTAHFKKEELISPYLNTDNTVLYYDGPGIELMDVDDSVQASAETTAVILIVEDNAEVRNFIRQSLKQRYRVLEAVNGKEGLALAFDYIPDLIVSDVMMPEMDGLELCRLLKTDERSSHIPVVLLTARSGNIHEVSGLQTGADAYMTKPFGVNKLLLTISNLLTLQANMRRRFSQHITLQPANILIESTDEVFLNKVMVLIESNLNNTGFSVAMLAAGIGMSAPVLYRKIKALTGMTVNNFMKSVRLKRAAQLLKQKNNTVYEVAYMVGFSDSKYFSKEFTRQYGLTPSEYVSAG